MIYLFAVCLIGDYVFKRKDDRPTIEIYSVIFIFLRKRFEHLRFLKGRERERRKNENARYYSIRVLEVTVYKLERGKTYGEMRDNDGLSLLF